MNEGIVHFKRIDNLSDFAKLKADMIIWKYPRIGTSNEVQPDLQGRNYMEQIIVRVDPDCVNMISDKKNPIDSKMVRTFIEIIKEGKWWYQTSE
jgi:hypothetical protein